MALAYNFATTKIGALFHYLSLWQLFSGERVATVLPCFVGLRVIVAHMSV